MIGNTRQTPFGIHFVRFKSIRNRFVRHGFQLELRKAVMVLAAVVAYGAAASSTWARPPIIEGRVVGVADGDTLTLLDAGKHRHKIRLSEIDAPETSGGALKGGQPFGRAAKQSLSDMVYGRMVSAHCPSSDKYGRLICQVIVDSRDVNLEQVRRGMAWVYRKYATRNDYFAAEEHAKSSRKGLWQDDSPIPPWDWRR